MKLYGVRTGLEPQTHPHDTDPEPTLKPTEPRAAVHVMLKKTRLNGPVVSN